MRKALTILALLGLAVGISARTASADGVDYTVSGTFGSTVFGDTSLSTTGDSFTVSFSVNPADLTAGSGDMANPIGVTFDYTDFLGGTVNFSLTGQPGMVTFYTAGAGGLFDLDFNVPSPSGNMFILRLEGTDAGFDPGPPPTLNVGGPFAVTPGDTLGDGSFLGELDPSGMDALGLNSITTGTVTASATAMPEPSSMLLLGSGFLALGTFARKRLFARGN